MEKSGNVNEEIIMAHHTLKIEEQFMEAKTLGDKPFEIRYNDRGFQKGDTITYKTARVPTMEYEGLYEITYVTAFAQKDNWVVFGDREIKQV